MSKPVSLTLISNQTNSSTNWTLDSSSNNLVFSCTDSNKSIDLGHNVLAQTFTGDLSGNAVSATKIASITNSDIVQLEATQTLSNKKIRSFPTEMSTITGTVLLGDDCVFTGNTIINGSVICPNINVSGLQSQGKTFGVLRISDNQTGQGYEATRFRGSKTQSNDPNRFSLMLNILLVGSLNIISNTCTIISGIVRSYSVRIGGHLNVSGTITNNSDDRLKHNEIDITNGLEIINKLKPQIYDKTFTIIDENNNNEEIEAPTYKESGFIAQEVNEINELKHLVSISENTDSENIDSENIDSENTDSENTDIELYMLNYIGIIPYNTAAIKELDQIVQSQEAIITSLETRIVLLESRLATLENS